MFPSPLTLQALKKHAGSPTRRSKEEFEKAFEKLQRNKRNKRLQTFTPKPSKQKGLS